MKYRGVRVLQVMEVLHPRGKYETRHKGRCLNGIYNREIYDLPTFSRCFYFALHSCVATSQPRYSRRIPPSILNRTVG